MSDLDRAFDLVRTEARIARTEAQIAISADAELIAMLGQPQASNSPIVDSKAHLFRRLSETRQTDALRLSEPEIVRRLIKAMIRATGEEGEVYEFSTETHRLETGGTIDVARPPDFEHRSQDDILYVRLGSLDDDTTRKLQSIIEDSSRTTRLILDLRGCPGGIVSNTIEIADLFIREGLLLKEGLGRDSTDFDTWYAKPGGPGEQMKLVVLIDGKTARGAELVAIALQHARRATLVGQPTLGDGLIHGVTELSQTRAIKLPILQMFGADQKQISGNPVRPDVTISSRNGSDAALSAAYTMLSSPR